MDVLKVVQAQPRTIRFRSLSLDLDRYCMCVGTAVVAASRAEFGLLQLLLRRRNTPMGKDVIMSALFGEAHGRDPRQIDIFVARLRQALAPFGLGGVIATVAGRGYAVLDEEHEVAPTIFAAPRSTPHLIAA